MIDLVRMASRGLKRYQGPRGGVGWVNSITGKVVYQDERPGDGEPAKKKSPAKRKGRAAKPAAKPAARPSARAAKKPAKKPAKKAAKPVRVTERFTGDAEGSLAELRKYGGGSLPKGLKNAGELASLGGASEGDESANIMEMEPGRWDISFGSKGTFGHTTVDMRDKSVRIELCMVSKEKRGTGFATDMLRNIVSNAQRLGLKKITLQAVEDGPAVWPKFGFSANLGEEELVGAPKGAKEVSDLMLTPEGREHYKTIQWNYDDVDFEMSLKPGSTDLKVFNEYMKSKSPKSKSWRKPLFPNAKPTSGSRYDDSGDDYDDYDDDDDY